MTLQIDNHLKANYCQAEGRNNANLNLIKSLSWQQMQPTTSLSFLQIWILKTTKFESFYWRDLDSLYFLFSQFLL